MKKLFTLITAVLVSLATMATTYTGDLTVSINGESLDPVSATIEVNKVNATTFDLSVKNFVLATPSMTMYVGNINLENIAANANGKLAAMYVDQNVVIENGDMELPSGQFWYGPMLGPVPLKMFAYFVYGRYLIVDIDIDMMDVIGQIINVHFDNGEVNYNDFQLPNGDFESWTASSGEPDRWHGFKSASGDLASSASSVLQKSTDCHGGQYSANAQSAVVFGINANGTITSGQLNAGSMSAADATGNYSYMDINSTNKDKNGDPFYMEVYGKPDAISFWFKFTQGKANSAQPNASFNAVIFDGTRYQDPEGETTYSNKVAVAGNQTIKTSSTFKQYTINFDYNSYAENNAEANAILVTASTNAVPGGGSKNSLFSSYKDNIWIDDIELIYNPCVISDIKLKGSSISDFRADKYEYEIEIGKDDVYTDADIAESYTAGVGSLAGHYVKEIPGGFGYVVTVYAISGDFHVNMYTINLNRPSATLANIIAGNSADVIVADNLINVMWDDDNSDIYATDGANSWVRLHFDDSSLYDLANQNNVFTGKRIAGVFNSDALDPMIEVSSINGTYDEETIVDILPLDLANTTDWDAVKPNQVMTITGYYFDGKLRAFSGNNGNKGASIDLDFGSSDAASRGFVEGAYVKVTAAMTMHEAWSGAPRRVNSSYDYDFQNLVAKVLADAEDATTTAVTDLNSDATVVSTRYFNVEGRELAEPAQGVTIVVNTLSDGTVKATKVLK